MARRSPSSPPESPPEKVAAKKRGPGRPKIGAGSRRFNITLPPELADFLDETGTPSATIAQALREMMARRSRR